MIILLCGASHSGKTLLAQRLLEQYHYPYLSIDHLKMGLIRSGNTELTPMDDEKLTEYLWPIVREMVKTAIENHQNLIVEGCYIPFDWRKDFSEEDRKHILYRCLIMSRAYIEKHFADIQAFGSAIEKRCNDADLDKQELIYDNERNLRLCREYGCDYIWIDDRYEIKGSDLFFVRAACFADLDWITRTMITSFRTAFSSFVSEKTMIFCTNFENCRAMLENTFQSEHVHFLVGGNQGFLCWQETGDGAELMAIHTLPESWGTGLGHALLTEALRQIGDRSVYLWAFQENTRARRFYEKHGFYFDGSQRVSEFDNAIEVRYVYH